MSKKLLLCFALFIGLVSFAFAQRTVTGTVTDELTKEPLIQATVVIKGTTQGTVTDENGKFKLENVPNNAVLTVSYAGYPSIDVNSGVLSDVNIALKPDETAGEVVIKGYLIEDKRSSVGAIAGIKGAVIEGMPAQSFDRAMQGRIAGVQINATSGQPGGALSVRVRGTGSLNASNAPLYIIDGVQVRVGGLSSNGSSNALGAINPNDIESIEVLKDASASAIYGAQASNGVVIITTKRGKKGKSQVNVTIQEGIVQPSNLYNVMDARQLAQYRLASAQNSGLKSREQVIRQFGDPSNPNLQSYDWANAIFRAGRQQMYDISLNGGDDKTTFFVSGSYNKQEGQVVKNAWDRSTIKANFTHKASDKLTVGLNLNGSWQNSNGAIEASTSDGNFVNNPFNAAFSVQPGSPAINPETGAYNIYPVYFPVNATGSNLNSAPNFGYNPLQLLNEEPITNKVFQFIGSNTISYKLNKDFTINTLIAGDFINGREERFRTPRIPTYAGSRTGPSLAVTNRRFFNFNGNANIQYSKTFNNIHRVSAILGYEYKMQQVEASSAQAFGYYNLGVQYPQLSTASNTNPAGGTQAPVVGGSFSESKRQGVFAQAKYDYADKYFIEGTLRRDGSSRFGAENRSGWFYAGAIAWRLSAESFMEKTKNLISDLKLRVSYGVLGNSEIGDYTFLGTFGSSVNNNQYNGTPLIRVTNLPNPALGWERQAQFNVGTDIELWKGKVRLTLDYWNKTNSELLLSTPLVGDGGVGAYTANSGKMRNRGFDIDLSTTNIDKNGFKWVTSFNISFLKNEILALPGGQSRLGNAYFVGQPYGTIWGDKFLGVNPANGRPVYADTSGRPTYMSGTTLTEQIIGKTNPDYFGGLNNTFSYKGITLDIFFQYQVGNDAFLGDLFNIATSFYGDNNQLTSQLAYWQKPGDVTNVPIPVDGGVLPGVIQGEYQNSFVSTRHISDASYIRLKQVRLSYEVPSDLLSKFGLRRVNVYAQAINLWTYTKFAGIDPEVVGQISDGGGSNFGAYPQGRQFNVGAVFGF